MTRWPAIIINVILFDALWTLAVFGAGKSWWFIAPLLITLSVMVQLRWSPSPAREGLLILGGAMVGMMADCTALVLGLFRHASASRFEFFAVFLSLWINFGSTLRPSLRWIWHKPAIAALLGLLGGPIAYFIASRIGAITPSEPAWRAFAWCAVQYALILPLWGLAASRIFSDAPAPVHPSRSREAQPSRGTPPS